jgi:hypothetical protein
MDVLKLLWIIVIVALLYIVISVSSGVEPGAMAGFILLAALIGFIIFAMVRARRRKYPGHSNGGVGIIPEDFGASNGDGGGCGGCGGGFGGCGGCSG